MVSFPTRTVNIAMLVLVTFELVSGLWSFTIGEPDGRWVFWLHRIAGFALVVLLIWKWGIVTRSYRRRGLTLITSASALLGLLYIGSLITGAFCATTGFPGMRLPFIGSVTGLGLHVTLSLALIPLFLLHAIVYWPRPQRVDFLSRRAALRAGGLSTAGLVLWQGSEAASRAAGLSGSRRRFTGSRERGSLSGNGYPRTNWLTDPFPAIPANDWQLRIHGLVEREATLLLADLERTPSRTHRATLDCTGGWYTVQDWTGVPLLSLLNASGVLSTARTAILRSETGYTRRFTLNEIDDFLLATHVGDEPLSRGHGYPVRLVAPGHRGFEWVKWVSEVEVSDEPAWWQPPPPEPDRPYQPSVPLPQAPVLESDPVPGLESLSRACQSLPASQRLAGSDREGR